MSNNYKNELVIKILYDLNKQINIKFTFLTRVVAFIPQKIIKKCNKEKTFELMLGVNITAEI